MLRSFRGQGDAFMILIGSIIGVLILAIILGVIASFEKTECDSSIHTVYERFRTAVNLPTGEIISQKNLHFCTGNIFTRKSFGATEGLDDDCVILDGTPGRQLVVESPFSVSFQSSLRADVYFACAKPPYPDGYPIPATACRLACWIGFNKSRP